MKEKGIAALYIEALAIDKDSEAGQRLMKFSTPSVTNKRAGDFGNAVYLSMEDRCVKKSKVSIKEINDYLDRLSVAPDKGARLAIWKKLVHETTALMQKWIVRIMLKDLKLGFGEKFLFNYLHPDAYTLFNATMNMKKVCEELTDRSKRTEDKMVQLFSPVKPMLAEQQSIQDILHLLNENGNQKCFLLYFCIDIVFYRTCS